MSVLYCLACQCNTKKKWTFVFLGVFGGSQLAVCLVLLCLAYLAWLPTSGPNVATQEKKLVCCCCFPWRCWWEEHLLRQVSGLLHGLSNFVLWWAHNTVFTWQVCRAGLYSTPPSLLLSIPSFLLSLRLSSYIHTYILPSSFPIDTYILPTYIYT